MADSDSLLIGAIFDCSMELADKPLSIEKNISHPYPKPKKIMRFIRYILLSLALLLATPAWADVVITEFLASNQNGLLDEDGATSDWIELYNDGAAPVNLSGWRLTDDSADLFKWTFPAATIEPKGFLIVFASNKNRAVATAPLHTNFKLNSDGGYLALVRPDTTFSTVFNPYPAQ